MIRFTGLAILLVSGFSFAQGMPQGMPPGFQEAMACMESIDQNALDKMGNEADKLSDKVDALCEKGDEAGAKRLVLDYVQSMQSNPELIKMQTCITKMQEAMPGMPMPQMPTVEMMESKDGSVCDDS